MKVKINTGKSYRPTCIVDVVVTFRPSKCIEIDCPIDLHHPEDERPNVLDESYYEIATTIFGENSEFELDERDQRTMWIWEKKSS